MLTGFVTDSIGHKPLSYVNIGIKRKNIGTVSSGNGAFSLHIPKENIQDTVTFSLVGYHEVNLPVQQLLPEKALQIRLTEKITNLNEVQITGKKWVEKKFGITKRNSLIHFTDGMFSKEDIFEIAQVINLGEKPSRVTSANIYINAPREDSASFRINFYRYDEHGPAKRIVEKNIIQRHAVKEGWLKFDLKAYNIVLTGMVALSIEFIPETVKDVKPVFYEVKLGGTSRSYYRRNSQGKWNTPPHHYCLYLTALVNENTPDEADDQETAPALTLRSSAIKDTFNIFVRLPKGYRKSDSRKYPVIYHLDGNAYFDHINNAVAELTKEKKLKNSPIIVGIGYRNAYLMDSLRNRDYTFPEAVTADSFQISGGGDKFYDFLKNEVIPQIEKEYNTDSTSRTLMGHSLGGYFVLYALLQNLQGNPCFDNYVAASPSLMYHDKFIVKQFDTLQIQDRNEKQIRLFLTTGELETGNDRNYNFDYLKEIFQKWKFIEIESKIYENLEHMGTAVPSFRDGINFIN